MLTSLWCCRLGVDNLDKLVMILKNWLTNAWTNCPQKRQFIIEFLVEQVGIIDKNDTLLDAFGYFNIMSN